MLARDDNGVYYYIDRWKEKHGGRHYRVFVGRRGQQKLSKLTGVVNDSRGTIFSTPSGDLRLVVDKRGGRGAMWIQGKRAPKKLKIADPKRNLTLIYEELGAYIGQDFGHICEF